MSLKGNVDAQGVLSRESHLGQFWGMMRSLLEQSDTRKSFAPYSPPLPSQLHPVIEPGRALSIPHPASPLGPGRSPRSCQLLPLQKEMWKWWVQADNLAKFFSPESRGVSPASHSDRNGAQESRKHQDALWLRQGRHCGEPLGPKTQGQMGVRTSQQMPTRTCDPGKASSYHPTPASALC